MKVESFVESKVCRLSLRWLGNWEKTEKKRRNEWNAYKRHVFWGFCLFSILISSIVTIKTSSSKTFVVFGDGMNKIKNTMDISRMSQGRPATTVWTHLLAISYHTLLHWFTNSVWNAYNLKWVKYLTEARLEKQ